MITHPRGGSRADPYPRRRCRPDRHPDRHHPARRPARGGIAHGRQVVPRSWVEESTRPSFAVNRGYGLHWWLDDDGAFSANGLGGQVIHVSPKYGVVIVKSTLATVLAEEEAETAFRAVAAEVARTRRSRPALP
ncbi:hypothetical protein ACGFNU_22265 [Spirillospora sp. NPDC048911]|uniref:hypothetical protein n=1 Tax=Spirillospora sp. NPDC048911 TaxID=3364527 RepID=UPI00371054C5